MDTRMVKTTAVDVDILTADHDRHNIAFIDNARDAGRIGFILTVWIAIAMYSMF